MLIEIFRIADGRLAEAWEVGEGPDPRVSHPRTPSPSA
jgi:hypothetical protein